MEVEKQPKQFIPRKKREYRLSDVLESVFIAILIALVIRQFFFTAYKIPTSAMAPTLRPGDFVIGNKFTYGLKIPFTQIKFFVSSPKRGDLVVFKYNDKPNTGFLKRVIGVAGDHIEIKNRQIYVNEKPLPLLALEKQAIQDLPGADFLLGFQETFGDLSYNVIYSDSGDPVNFGPVSVPEGEVFLIGDNRDASDDSRYWGTVPIGNIEAKALLVWMSLDWGEGGSRAPSFRFERFFKSLD